MAQKNAWNKYKKDEIKELESLCKEKIIISTTTHGCGTLTKTTTEVRRL